MNTEPTIASLAKSVRRAYLDATERDVNADMQRALTLHLDEFAALPALRDRVLASHRGVTRRKDKTDE